MDLGNLLESYDIVPGFHGCDTFANRFNNTSAFMAKNNRESSFGIFPRESVGI